MRHINRQIVHIVIVLALGILAYSGSFGVPFQFDDFYNITENPAIRDVSDIPSMIAGEGGRWASRPLLQVSLALNYHFNEYEPWGYHVVNLSVHLLNGLLLYMLIVLTGSHRRYEEDTLKLIAFFSSALFVVHPLQTEAVTYIVGRSMLFAAMFYLLGLILFHKAVTSEGKRGLYIAGLFTVSLLGMGSRENFATFPLMLVLYDLFFISGFKVRVAIKNHFGAYLPVIISGVYLAYLVSNNTYARLDEPMALGMPPLQYALTQFNVHWTYLRLLALPFGQSIDYDYPTARTLLELPTLLSFAGYICLCAAAVVLARRSKLASFSIIWFLVLLLPISFGVAVLGGLRLGDVIFEHRSYLPAMAIFPAAVAGSCKALGCMRGAIPRRTLGVALSIMLIALSAATYARNITWQSEAGLWEDAVSKSPRKARTHYELGVVYSIEGQADKAIREFDSALALYPGYAYAHIELGIAQAAKGSFHEAAESFRQALKINPDLGYVHGNLGAVYSSMGSLEDSVAHYKEAVRLEPSSANSHFNLGVTYYQMGSYELAAREFETCLRLDPGDSRARQYLHYLRDSH